MINPETKTILRTIVCGWLVCVLCGLIFFGFQIFQMEKPLFLFVTAGCIGSVAFALFLQNRLRDALFGLTLLSVLELIIFGLKHPVTHILIIFALILPLYFFAVQVFKKLNFFKSIRPIIIAGMMAISFIGFTLILHIFYAPDGEQLMLFRNMPIGFLIGLSLGIGFELAQNIRYR